MTNRPKAKSPSEQSFESIGCASVTSTARAIVHFEQEPCAREHNPCDYRHPGGSGVRVDDLGPYLSQPPGHLDEHGQTGERTNATFVIETRKAYAIGQTGKFVLSEEWSESDCVELHAILIHLIDDAPHNDRDSASFAQTPHDVCDRHRRLFATFRM